jgi:hypothetical protein
MDSAEVSECENAARHVDAARHEDATVAMNKLMGISKWVSPR